MIEIPTISMLYLFCFRRNHNGNVATLLFCVILAIAPYINYIKIRVENLSFNNLCKLLNLYESNAVQIFELMFCDSEKIIAYQTT